MAVSRLRSVSEMLMGMSAAEPTFKWDIRMESSPGVREGGRSSITVHPATDHAHPAACSCHCWCSPPVTLAVKGLPGMCCSLYLTRML